MKLTKILKFLLIFLIINFTLSYLYLNNFFQEVNYKLSDTMYGGQEALNNIVIIGIDDKSLQEIGRWPWNRNNFTQIINKLNNSKIIAIDVGFYESSNSDKELINILSNKENIVLAIEIDKDEILKPFNLTNSQKLGYVNINLDSDGVVRNINFNKSNKYSSFSSKIYEKIFNETYSKSEKFNLNYIGESNSYPIYSFSDVLNNKIDSSQFENKIILIGATSPGLRDIFLTPTAKSQMMSGVEIHANSLQTQILENDIKKANNKENLILIFLISIFTLILVRMFSPYISLFLTIIMVLFILFILLDIFESKNYLFNIIFIPFSAFTNYVGFLIYFYIEEKNRKKEIQNAFGKYTSPVLIDQILKNPKILNLGGEKRKVTILFSDIADFTTISEMLKPEDLVSFLNEYLNEMTEILLENNGFLDKFIGDAVMGFWGAPLGNKNQVEEGCETAIKMIEKVNELRPHWKEKYGVNVAIRIGLNTDEVIAGNLGSQNRFDYTVIGDGVNLASRLEAINKGYGTEIMVSDKLYEQIKEKYHFRAIDLVTVKGKKKPTKIYELLGREITNEQKEMIKYYEKGFELYLNKKFKEAIKEFEKSNEILKNKASNEFIKRCEYFVQNPVEKDWNGVFEMKTK